MKGASSNERYRPRPIDKKVSEYLSVFGVQCKIWLHDEHCTSPLCSHVSNSQSIRFKDLIPS